MLKKFAVIALAFISVLILTACAEDATKTMTAQEIMDTSIADFSQVKNYSYTFAIKAVEYATPVITDAPDVNTGEETGDATPPPGADIGGDGEGEGVAPADVSPDASLSPDPSASPDPSESSSTEPSPSASTDSSPAASVPLGAQYGSTYSSAVFTSPLMTRSTLTVDSPVSLTANAFFSQEGTDYFMYEKPGDTWIRRRLANDRTVNEYFKLHFVDCYSVLKTYIKDLTSVGTEKDKDGKDLTKFQGTLSADTVPMLLFQAGFSVTGDETTKALGDMPITIWVDSKDLKLSHINIDMTQNLNVLVDEANKQGSEGEDTALDETKISLTYASVSIDCTFTDYDKVPAVEIPADAKSQTPQDFQPYTTDDAGS